MLRNKHRFGENLSPTAQGIELARRFREEHQLALGPIERIEHLTELVDADLLITQLPDKVDALTVQDPITRNIVIGVATSSVPFRQNFSLAHEVGHIYAGDLTAATDLNPCLQHDAEVRADSFAAHILCPLDSLEEQLEGRDPSTEEALSHIVQRYKISPRVALSQLRRAGLIASDRASKLGRTWSAPSLASRFAWRNEYDLEVVQASTPRPAPRLVADATQAYLDGEVAAEAVALARGIPPQQVHDELDSLFSTDDSEESDPDPFSHLDSFFGED